jgi:hypothetical protein
MLPVYVEAENSDCPAPWLACRGQHIPLKRVIGVRKPTARPVPPAGTTEV